MAERYQARRFPSSDKDKNYGENFEAKSVFRYSDGASSKETVPIFAGVYRIWPNYYRRTLITPPPTLDNYIVTIKSPFIFKLPIQGGTKLSNIRKCYDRTKSTFIEPTFI